MAWSLWWLYVSLAGALIVAPGPSALLCVSHAVVHGARRTLATIVGGLLASMTLMALSALGLGAVIAASDTLFMTIKWAGAAYLVYLGISAWRSASAAGTPQVLATEGADADAEPSARPGVSRWALLRKGYMVGIGNPKDLLFFSALFPQFMNPSAPIAGQLLILASTWCVLDASVMFGYAVCGASLAQRLRQGRAARWFQRATGSAFIAAGGALATAHR